MKQDFDLSHYAEKIRKSDAYFQTIVDRPSLAAGVLVLGPNDEDTQQPHDTDEIYYVISGNGYLRIGDVDYNVLKGKLFFVAKNVKHFFHGNSKEIVVLYFFGCTDS